jgi:hypothetical protein
MRTVIYLQVPIWNRWRNQFCQVFNVHEINHVKQTEIHTAEPPVLEIGAFEFEMDIIKLARHKSPHIDQVCAEVI